MAAFNRKNGYPNDFNVISLKLASPERILEWSYGEVTKPETINYRTGRSERGGLFDERIFGPEKDYECYCGKYRRIRYKDIICERCGVEVTHSIVRRERMGHIELASPVTHIWFARSIPSNLGLFLDLSVTDLEKVIYFAGYIITSVDEEEKNRLLKEVEREYKQCLKSIDDEVERETLRQTMLDAKSSLENLEAGRVLDEFSYHRLSLKYGPVFEASIGAEALYQICANTDLNQLMEKLADRVLEVKSPAEKRKLQRRHHLVRSMRRSGVRPEWMFLTVLPIIPPDLRPVVTLDGGRHATSDVNDLYRRVINRNNRLKKLKELNAPDVILRNEKRILQEAVDALIDSSIRRGATGGAAGTQLQRRTLRSLADNLKGKQGRFRQNLLGKRVDYSGRSVIVIGPELKLNQCGLPKLMALELFRPFVIGGILSRELAFNVRGANRLIDDQSAEVWEILEEVIRDKHVLLNRAPTLHRLGIQAFRPVLIEGSAIRVHPLVCSAFNADFDGDQMAVHVPLSATAQKEVEALMSADKNLLKPGTGRPIVNLRLDIVLGCYWLTRIKEGAVVEGRVFADPEEAVLAHQFDVIDIRAKIKVGVSQLLKQKKVAGEILETSVGRIIFNDNLPDNFPFINGEVNNKEIDSIVERLLADYPREEVVRILDRLKTTGFYYASYSAVTWGVDEVFTPKAKTQIVAKALKEDEQLYQNYVDGLLSSDEKYRLTIKLWAGVRRDVEKALLAALPVDGSVMTLLSSGARGSATQVSQMGGMKGLILNPAGRPIDFPIISSYKEGLTPLEYFVTTHGSRKTLTDTALNTAKAGYLTRRLVHVAENILVTEEDCGDTEGNFVSTERLSGFDRRITHLVSSRVLAKDLVAPNSKKPLFRRGHLLIARDAAAVEEAGITEACIRSLLTCKAVSGVCQTCYGLDLGRGGLVKIGEPVGIVAAQAIGEPGTQLTMRTKHSGGVDVGGDIVGGLPRVEEIFERRIPKNPAIISETDGSVLEIEENNREGLKTLVIRPDKSSKKKDGESNITYKIPRIRDIWIKEGDRVVRGQILTDGPVDLADLFKLAGKDAAEEYIIEGVNKIYELQGVSLSRKHLEVIVRQMFSRRKIRDAGDTHFDVGETVEEVDLVKANQEAEEGGGKSATAEVALMGISEVALSSRSFIAAVSFGQTARVLIKTAVRGGFDRLRGLKENIIVGRLIPAGSGLPPKETSDHEQTDE